MKPHTPKISVNILKTDKTEQVKEAEKKENPASKQKENKEKCQEKLALKEKVSRELQITLIQLTRMMGKIQKDEYKILFEKWLGEGGIANILNMCLVEDKEIWRHAMSADKEK